MTRKSLALSRPVMLVLMGLSLGFSLNMLLSSILTNNCNSFSTHNGIVGSKSSDEHSEEHYELHYKSKNEVEIEANLYNAGKKHRVVRPRFLSSELGLKEKLVVSVLTSSDTLETFGTAINKTMLIPNSESKLMFFMDGIVKESSNRMHLVMFSQVEKHLIPFFMLKYLADNYLASHNWFYIFPDTTFVHREKLEEFVNRISVGDNLIIGNNFGNKSKMCDFDAGILISNSVLMNLSKNIEWCMKYSLRHENHSQNIERCLHYSMTPLNLTCSGQINELTYQSLKLSDMVDNINTLSQNSFISISHATSETVIYTLCRRLAEINKIMLDSELQKLIGYDEKILPFTPNENLSASWPLGVEMSSRAKNRFDVLRWHYINGSHIFYDRFQENLKPLIGIEKLDVTDILKEAMSSVNKNEQFPLNLEKLINGYRRFDASRGMEYILDVLVSRTKLSTINQPTIKRIHVVKPLGFAEVVPAPYVNENTQIQLVLKVTEDERDSVSSFIESFVRTCVEFGDNSQLLIVFVYENLKEQSDDIYSNIKSTLSFYDNKYRKEQKISWTSIVSSHSHKLVLDVMEVVQRRLPLNAIVLTCTTGMELKIEFLNHVRMNTISGSQVYFPIGYLSYKPHLVYDKPPYPSSILINQKSGYYAAAHYDHASFYLSDFVFCKNQMLSIGAETNFLNLFEMFVRYHSINVFRAVDPALRMHYKAIKCPEHQNNCHNVKHRSLASRSQLAMLLFEHLQNHDELPLDIMQQ